jgi:hypothetical protein
MSVPIQGQILSDVHYCIGTFIPSFANDFCPVDKTVHHTSLNVGRVIV